MRKTARSLFLLTLLSGSAIVGLVACFEDFNVLPPGADAGPLPGVDSSTPPSMTEGGSTTDAGVDSAKADSGPPPTHCDSVVAPPGAADFLCVDFDSPLLVKGWDNVNRTDGGTLEKTTDVAVSPPFALATTTSGFATATLTWAKTGAKAFTEATAVIQVNPGQLGGVVPPANGTMELLEIRTTNALVTFGYSRGSTEFDGSPYTGYFMYNAAFGGAAALNRYKITTAQLPVNVWTEVKIAWEAGGKLNVFYNNINVLGVNGFGSNDTKVSFRLGAHASGNVGVMPLHRFDNALVSIRR